MSKERVRVCISVSNSATELIKKKNHHGPYLLIICIHHSFISKQYAMILSECLLKHRQIVQFYGKESFCAHRI